MRCLKETILRIARKHTGEPLESSKLTGLVFLCDLKAWERHRQSITDAVFTRTENGIISEQVMSAISELVTEELITRVRKSKRETVLLIKPTSAEYAYRLTGKALKCIDSVVSEHRKRPASAVLDDILSCESAQGVDVGEVIEPVTSAKL